MMMNSGKVLMYLRSPFGLGPERRDLGVFTEPSIIPPVYHLFGRMMESYKTDIWKLVNYRLMKKGGGWAYRIMCGSGGTPLPQS